MGYADIKTSECYVHLVDVRKRAAVEAIRWTLEPICHIQATEAEKPPCWRL
jgi:hypothetical protein